MLKKYQTIKLKLFFNRDSELIVCIRINQAVMCGPESL